MFADIRVLPLPPPSPGVGHASLHRSNPQGGRLVQSRPVRSGVRRDNLLPCGVRAVRRDAMRIDAMDGRIVLRRPARCGFQRARLFGAHFPREGDAYGPGGCVSACLGERKMTAFGGRLLSRVNSLNEIRLLRKQWLSIVLTARLVQGLGSVLREDFVSIFLSLLTPRMPGNSLQGGWVDVYDSTRFPVHRNPV